MFILTTIEDLIEIKPQDLAKPSAAAIKDAINTKYSNRIIQQIGLCICMFDLLDASEGLIGHGTGLVNVNVEFRMIVFRPFRGEILYGRIKHSNEDGIMLDLDFYSEVWIPRSQLFPDTHFHPSERVWIWDSKDEDTGEVTELFFDAGEPVLFRVENEEWVDQKPTVTKRNDKGDVITSRETGWKITGSMNQSGCGPNLWWGIGPGEEADPQEANAEGEAGEEEGEDAEDGAEGDEAMEVDG